MSPVLIKIFWQPAKRIWDCPSTFKASGPFATSGLHHAPLSGFSRCHSCQSKDFADRNGMEREDRRERSRSGLNLWFRGDHFHKLSATNWSLSGARPHSSRTWCLGSPVDELLEEPNRQLLLDKADLGPLLQGCSQAPVKCGDHHCNR